MKILKKLLSIVLLFNFVFSVLLSADAIALENLKDDEVKFQTEKKHYTTATIKDDFSINEIIIVMNKNNSFVNQIHNKNKFNEIKIISSEDLTAFTNKQIVDKKKKQNSFHQILKLTIKSNTKKELLDAIRILEKRSDILSAEPNFYIPLDQPVKNHENIKQMDNIELNGLDNSEINSVAGSLDESIELMGNPAVNDPILSDQWALKNIKAEEAWNQSAFSPSNNAKVKVGVIDSGISNHEDLAENLILGYDFYNENTDTTDDTEDHGTHVAGIIGAVSNNAIGISGIARNVQLVPLQVMHATRVDVISVIKSITYADDNNIPIINMSLGSYTYNDAYYSALENYSGLVVCAAGNDRCNNDITPLYPASYDLDNIISVANITESNVLDEFDNPYGYVDEYGNPLISGSNYGASNVDLAAPGTFIYSTIQTNSYCTNSGTSQAAPMVTGVAALLKTNFPQATTAQLKSAILNSVTPTSSLNGKVATGGRLNALAALQYLSAIHDDYGNSINSSAYSWNIASDATSTRDGRLGTSGDIDVFKFVAPVSGSYTFFSSDCTGDIYGRLYNSSGTSLIDDNNSGGNSNFKFTYSLLQGETYYLRVANTNSSSVDTGHYKVSVRPPSLLTKTLTIKLNSVKSYLNQTSVYIDPTNTSIYPFTLNRIQMLPLRTVDYLGMSFNYTNQMSPFSVEYKGSILTFTADSNTVLKYTSSTGTTKSIPLSTPPRLIEGKMYVPARNLLDYLDLSIYYDDASYTTVISNEPLTYSERQNEITLGSTLSSSVVAISSISAIASTRTLTVGGSVTITSNDINFNPVTAGCKRLLFSSNDTSKVNVTSQGKITGVSKGKAIITVTSHNGKTTEIAVTVK